MAWWHVWQRKHDKDPAEGPRPDTFTTSTATADPELTSAVVRNHPAWPLMPRPALTVDRPMPTVMQALMQRTLASHTPATGLMSTAMPLGHEVRPDPGGLVSSLLRPVTSQGEPSAALLHAGPDLVLRRVTALAASEPASSPVSNVVRRSLATVDGHAEQGAAPVMLAVGASTPSSGADGFVETQTVNVQNLTTAPAVGPLRRLAGGPSDIEARTSPTPPGTVVRGVVSDPVRRSVTGGPEPTSLGNRMPDRRAGLDAPLGVTTTLRRRHIVEMTASAQSQDPAGTLASAGVASVLALPDAPAGSGTGSVAGPLARPVLGNAPVVGMPPSPGEDVAASTRSVRTAGLGTPIMRLPESARSSLPDDPAADAMFDDAFEELSMDWAGPVAGSPGVRSAESASGSAGAPVMARSADVTGPHDAASVTGTSRAGGAPEKSAASELTVVPLGRIPQSGGTGAAAPALPMAGVLGTRVLSRSVSDTAPTVSPATPSRGTTVVTLVRRLDSPTPRDAQGGRSSSPRPANASSVDGAVGRHPDRIDRESDHADLGPVPAASVPEQTRVPGTTAASAGTVAVSISQHDDASLESTPVTEVVRRTSSPWSPPEVSPIRIGAATQRAPLARPLVLVGAGAATTASIGSDATAFGPAPSTAWQSDPERTAPAELPSAGWSSAVTNRVGALARPPLHRSSVESAVPTVLGRTGAAGEARAGGEGDGVVARRVDENPSPGVGGYTVTAANEAFETLMQREGDEAVVAPVGGAASAAGAAGASAGGSDLDALAQSLYERIRHRLRRELLDDRERAGFLLDRMR